MTARKPRKRKSRIAEQLIVAALLLLFAGTAAAEHEANHRYNVRGYVLDADRKPVNGTAVSVYLDGIVIGSDRTDGDGYYSIRLHLHDSDIGRTLELSAGGDRATIRMRAERGDLSTPRVHHANFVGGGLVEQELAGRGIPAWAYVAAAPVVLWAGYYLTGAARRGARRMKKARSKAETQKQGKRRRQR